MVRILLKHSRTTESFFTPFPAPIDIPLPHPSQQHADLQHVVIRLQQEVTRPKATFKTSLAREVGLNKRLVKYDFNQKFVIALMMKAK